MMRGSALLAGPRLRGERRRAPAALVRAVPVPVPVLAAGTREPRVDTPVHVAAEFRGSVQARGRRVPGRYTWARFWQEAANLGQTSAIES